MDNFDWKYYVENNPDLKENNITTKEKAIKHWNSYGKNENRKHKFLNNIINKNEKQILENILKQIDINNKLINNNILSKNESWDCLNDYIKNNLTTDKNNDNQNNINENNINENMNYFDCEYYSKYNPDFKKNNIIKDVDLRNHWLKYGKYEDRKYKFFENIYLKKIPFKHFDWVYYLKNNIDLIDNNINNAEKAWNHWCNYGKYEYRKYKWINGITIKNFDWKYYISQNNLDKKKYSKKEVWNHLNK